MSPERAAALSRLLVLVESARPADVRAIAAGLPEADLAVAIEAVRGRISLPLREYILEVGPSALLIALARQAVLGRGEAPANTVDRVLMRFDPGADAAFFDFDPGVSQVLRARRVVLRDRKGPDGRAVIPPKVKQALLEAVAAGEPDRRLLTEVAAADDPDLVLALMPYADKLRANEAACVISTLDAHGLRAEAKRHRRLWAGRGSDFTVLGFRRFAKLPAYAPDTGFSPAPGVEAMCLNQYRAFIEESQGLAMSEHGPVRERAHAALRAGTLSATEVLEHTRPAKLAVSLAICHHDGAPKPGEQRAADDIRALIARWASERLADVPHRWAHAVARVNDFPGTIAELFADADTAPKRAYLPDYSHYLRTDFDAANILLALAPPDIACRALLAKHMKSTIADIVNAVPLCRALVEHVIARGTIPQWQGLAANESAPDSVLARLLDKRTLPEVVFAIMNREHVGLEVLERACTAAPRNTKLKKWIIECARYSPARALFALRCAADDPAWVLKVLRDAIEELDGAEEVAAYALLAEVAGVEAVWALDLDRSGSLDAMNPHVRESMATGDAEPLLTEARSIPDEPPDEPPDAPWSRTDEELEQPLNRPLEHLIRTRLDGRADRWLELAELIQSEPHSSDVELISRFPPSSS